jgi:hypothetical protein
MQSSIEYYKQALVIDREIDNLNGIGTNLFNIALHHLRQRDTANALSLAQEAEHIWMKIGSKNVQRAQDLIAQLQGRKSQANSLQVAFEAFQRVDSIQSMQITINQYPFMMDDRFIQKIEQVIEQQVPPNFRAVVERQLSWLKQLAGK